MEMEIIVVVWLYLVLAVLALATYHKKLALATYHKKLALATYHKKKCDYLRDAITDKDTNTAILEDSLAKLRRDLRFYEDEYSEAIGQIIAIKEALKGTKENK